MNKGQFTLFVVFGILIILVIVFSLLLFNMDWVKSLTEEVKAVDDVNEISDEISLCFQLELDKELNVLGVQGGMINPENYIMIEGEKINTDDVSAEMIESELSSELERDIERCDTYGASYIGYINVDVSIGESVEASIDNEIMYNNRSTTLRDASVDVNLVEILNFVNEMKTYEPITYVEPMENFTIYATYYDGHYIYTIEKDDYWFVIAV